MSTAERHAVAADLLDLVGLPDHGGRFPHRMSGGRQQRVALARALALRPRVLLLDEPLPALDAKVRLTLREEIRRLQLSIGITTIFVTRVAGSTLPVDGEAPTGGGPVDVLIRPEAVHAEADPDGTAHEVAAGPGHPLSDADAPEVVGRAGADTAAHLIEVTGGAAAELPRVAAELRPASASRPRSASPSRTPRRHPLRARRGLRRAGGALAAAGGARAGADLRP